MALQLAPKHEPTDASYPPRRAPNRLVAALRGAAGAAGAALAIALACCGSPQDSHRHDRGPEILGGAVVAPEYFNDAGTAPDQASGADADGDGIGDDRDQCPQDPEDADAFADEDGCPDPDNDRDGIADLSDQCPNEPEDLDAVMDLDGCPEPQ